MTKSDIIKRLNLIDDDHDAVVICKDYKGGWDNIRRIEYDGVCISIIFGGGSPFSSDK